MRRVKCDQTRPACLRCVSTGRQCDGYADLPGDLLVTTAYSIPFRIPGGQKDRQLLHYFCVRGSIDISGAYSNNFWSQAILQISQDNTVVRQALLALSSLHLGMTTPETESLIRYGKAMRALKRSIAKPDKDTVGTALVCSVLFFCAECILGNHEAATGHLNNGLQLLAVRGPGVYEHDEAVSGMLARLDMQATFFDDSRKPILSIPAEERQVGLCHTPFASIEAVQHHCVRLQNWMFNLLWENYTGPTDVAQEVAEEVDQEKTRLRGEFIAWEQSLRSFKSTEDDMAMIQSLEFQHEVLKMLMDSRLPLDLTVFHTVPNHRARQLIRLAESTVEHLRKTWEKREIRQTFAAEIGILTPLFFLAVKCGDDQVCTRATELLLSSRCQEGLFNVELMAAMIEQLQTRRTQKMVVMEELGFVVPKNLSLEWWSRDLLESDEGYMTVLQGMI